MSRSHINNSSFISGNNNTPVAPNRSRRRAQSIGNAPNRNISAANTTPRGSLFSAGTVSFFFLLINIFFLLLCKYMCCDMTGVNVRKIFF